MSSLLREARSLSSDQRRAFLAAFLGWMLDGFDYTSLTFVLVDIQRSFTVDNTLAGALGTVTLMFRLVGGAAAGTVADRWGRKLPLILSILWFSIFTLLSGFSTSYAMLFAFRALFGIGMGGEWAAGMPLALGQEFALDLQLHPAGLTETVMVSAQANVIDLSSARMGAGAETEW